MKISQYTPDLTASEAERFWMTPVQVCQLAAIGDSSDPKVKKLLNTLSDRDHVPFVKSGEAKTAPRLYSLVSAAMLRIFFDITRDGRTYKYAQPVAKATRNTLIKAVSELHDIGDLDNEVGQSRLVFSGIDGAGAASSVRWVRGDYGGGMTMTYSVYDAGYLIYRLVEDYADYWYDDLVKRGVIEPNVSDKPKFTDDGFPIWGRE